MKCKCSHVVYFDLQVFTETIQSKSNTQWLQISIRDYIKSKVLRKYESSVLKIKPRGRTPTFSEKGQLEKTRTFRFQDIINRPPPSLPATWASFYQVARIKQHWNQYALRTTDLMEILKCFSTGSKRHFLRSVVQHSAGFNPATYIKAYLI